MNGLKYVLSGLAAISLTATAEAVSVPSKITPRIVIRTDLNTGQVEQLTDFEHQEWTALHDAMIIDPGVDFDKDDSLHSSIEHNSDVKPVGYGYAPARRRQFRYYYKGPTCGVDPRYGSIPCAAPGNLYARSTAPEYNVYRRPAFRIEPDFVYRQNDFYYQHFRRW